MSQPLAAAINKRFFNFLVSLQYALSQEDLDDGFIDLGSDQEAGKQASAKTPRPRQERILLEVERQKRKKDQQRQKAWEAVVARATGYLNAQLSKHILAQLEDGAYVAHELLRLPENLLELLHMTVSPASTLSKIAPLISAQISLKETMLRLANDQQFRNMMGRPAQAKVKDVRTAVGLIGLQLLAVLLPVTLFKRGIKLRNAVFPMMGEKLWSHSLTCGLSAEWLLAQEAHKRPIHGLFAGLFSQLGYVAIYEQYLQSFDTIKTQLLTEARDKNQRTLHDALFEVKPDPALFTQLAISHGKQVMLNAVDAMDWRDFPQVYAALDEYARDLPIVERGEIGRALTQAESYSRFELLKRAKIFSRADVTGYFDSVGVTEKALVQLLRACPRRLNIRGRETADF